MRRSVILMAAILSLAPVAAALADPVIVQVTYLGQGAFQYKGTAYAYDALVAAIQYDYAGQHIDGVSVDMGSVAPQLDKAKVCPLRQSLLTQVEMHITVDGQARQIFCN